MAVRDIAQTLHVTRDDHDWLLELGKQQGTSRIIGSQHEMARALIEQFRPPLSDGLSLPWAEANEYVRFMPGKVSIWSGPTFSGKTQFLRQLMLHSILQKADTINDVFENIRQHDDIPGAGRH